MEYDWWDKIKSSPLVLENWVLKANYAYVFSFSFSGNLC